MSKEFLRETTELFGVPVSSRTLKELVADIEACVASRRKLRIGVVNAAKIVKMKKDSLLRDSVLTSDVVIADGASITLAARMLAGQALERVTGIDLMNRLIESAASNGASVYLLGATDEISTILEQRLKETYPDLHIAGRRNGYFSVEEEQQVVEHINHVQPDYLFIGISSPKKEIFMAKWERELSATVIHGVGGSFDVVAGYVRRAPRLIQRAGLEWLYRLAQEPRRLAWRYISTNTSFVIMLVGEMLRKATSSRSQ